MVTTVVRTPKPREVCVGSIKPGQWFGVAMPGMEFIYVRAVGEPVDFKVPGFHPETGMTRQFLLDAMVNYYENVTVVLT